MIEKEEKNPAKMTWIARLMVMRFMNMVIMKLECKMMMITNWCGKGEGTRICKNEKIIIMVLVYTFLYYNYCFTTKFLSHMWKMLGYLISFKHFRWFFFEINTEPQFPPKLLGFNKYIVNKSSVQECVHRCKFFTPETECDYRLKER